MKRVFKRLLNNIAFIMMSVTIVCGGILGGSLLQLLFHYLSGIFNPIVGFILIMLVFALILGIFFTAVDEYQDRGWRRQDEELD